MDDFRKHTRCLRPDKIIIFRLVVVPLGLLCALPIGGGLCFQAEGCSVDITDSNLLWDPGFCVLILGMEVDLSAVTGMHALWWQALCIIEDFPFVQVPDMLIANL